MSKRQALTGGKSVRGAIFDEREAEDGLLVAVVVEGRELRMR